MLTDLDSLQKQAATGDGRGGRRPGSGRKKADGSPNKSAKVETPDFEVKSAEQVLAEGPPPEDDLVPPADLTSDMGAISFVVPANPGALYAGAKARKEAALAAKAELEFRIKAGQYLPREAVRSALATAFQAVAQSLRSVPDNLERKLGVSPEVAESVGTSIDEAMGELAYSLELIHKENTDVSASD